MTGPTIGGYQLTRRRVVIIALIVLDAILFATRSGGGTGLAAILLIWGGWVLFLAARTRLLWKVRNRLIVTYLFIFLVPMLLTLAFFLVAGWGLTGQFAGYMVSSAMEHREATIEAPARLLVRELSADRMAIVQQLTATGIPFQALVTGSQPFRYPPDAAIEMPPGDWKDYTGVVYKDNEPYLMSLVSRNNSRSLILMHLTRDVLGSLVAGLGSLGMPNLAATSGDKNATVFENAISSGQQAVAGRVPPPQNILDFEITGVAPVEIANWSHPNSGEYTVMVIATRLSAVLGIVLSDRILAFMTLGVAFFYAASILLGIGLLLSLFIGASMTRTITGAVHNLHEGTTSIGEGKFAHRIPVKGRDQLADLGHSFNKMADQLGQFVVVTKEKERLQSEISIAREVQARLFPLLPPPAKTIEMLGVCHAARSVSGDYYDYFTAADGELAIALGDVAGKGISAALLMASIQSIMRTQLADGGAFISPANCVARLNRLLYASTSPEKYATFFFGLYNEDTRRLNYTNAGHLQPLLIQGDSWKLLEVTGSVVGAFPSLKYEEESVTLGSGDLLIAYTDGITEPENAYGEDFGAERLAEVVMRHRDAKAEVIVEKVLEAVRHWDTSDEQADDMTLMIVRGLG